MERLVGEDGSDLGEVDFGGLFFGLVDWGAGVEGVCVVSGDVSAWRGVGVPAGREWILVPRTAMSASAATRWMRQQPRSPKPTARNHVLAMVR